MKAVWQLFVASVKGFLRDRASLFWTVAFPVFFIVIFGLVFGGSEEFKLKIGLVVEDQGPVAAGLAKGFQSIQSFTVDLGSRDAEIAALQKGDRQVVVVLPAGLSQAVTSGQQANVDMYYDSTNMVTSGTALSVVRQVLNSMDAQITGKQAVLVPQEKSVQSRHFRNIDFLVPGILAMAVMQLGVFGAITVVSYREKQIIKRMSVTPLPRSTVVISQVLFRLVVAFSQAIIIVLFARLVFNVQMVGNWGALVGLVLLGGLAFSAVGFIVASFAKTEESANSMTQLINFPMMFLSGIFFPLDMMPSFMQPIVKAMPLTYFADALRQEMVGMAGAQPMMLNVGVLVGWLVVSLAISFRFFRWD